MNMELSPKATEIVDHTKLLLAMGGYNGFSYADISDRVHIRKASIHHHFPSKAQLVHTVIVHYREQAREGMAYLDRHLTDPQARLNGYIGYWANCIRENTSPICICAMLAAELPMIPDEVADEVRGHFAELAAWLATVLEAGAAKGQFILRDSATAEANAFMAAIHGAMLTARAFNDPKAFESIAQVATNQLIAST